MVHAFLKWQWRALLPCPIWSSFPTPDSLSLNVFSLDATDAIGCLFSVFAMEIAIRKPVTVDTIVAHEIGCGEAIKNLNLYSSMLQREDPESHGLFLGWTSTLTIPTS